MPLTIWEILLLVVKFGMELWRASKKSSEEARLEAVAKITKDMNDDLQAVDKALATNDAAALSAHFELLRMRALKATGGNTGFPGNQGNRG